MKKVCILLLAVLLLMFAGCSNNQTDNPTENNEISSVISTAEVLPDESGTSSFSEGNNAVSDDVSEQATQNGSSSETTTPPATEKNEQTSTSSQQTPQKVNSTSTEKPKETESSAPKSTEKPEETAEQPVSEAPKPTQPPVTPSFDIETYITYANNYGISVGLKPDSTATSCWDNPLIASASSTTLKRDIVGLLNWYVAEGYTHFCVWSEKRSDGKYNLYIGYA